MIADRLQKLANFYLVYCRDPVRIKYGQHDYTIIDLSPPAGAAGGRWVSGQGKLGWAAGTRSCQLAAAASLLLAHGSHHSDTGPKLEWAAHVTQDTPQSRMVVR